MIAIFNIQLIGDSTNTLVVENNHYSPLESVNKTFLSPSNTKTIYPWKGTASYYNLEVDCKQNPDAAWYYPEPKSAAAEIKNYVAFWKGVKVS